MIQINRKNAVVGVVGGFFVLVVISTLISMIGTYFVSKAYDAKNAKLESQVQEAQKRAAAAEAAAHQLQGALNAKNNEIERLNGQLDASNQRIAALAQVTSERTKSYETVRNRKRAVFRGNNQREQSDELDAAARELYGDNKP